MSHKSNGLKELAASLGISKQRAWQILRSAEGKCTNCGSKRPPDDKVLCNKCRNNNRAKMRQLSGCKPWKEGGRGRPPLKGGWKKGRKRKTKLENKA